MGMAGLWLRHSRNILNGLSMIRQRRRNRLGKGSRLWSGFWGVVAQFPVCTVAACFEALHYLSEMGCHCFRYEENAVEMVRHHL